MFKNILNICTAQASPAYRDDFDATYDDYYDEDYENEVFFLFLKYIKAILNINQILETHILIKLLFFHRKKMVLMMLLMSTTRLKMMEKLRTTLTLI